MPQAIGYTSHQCLSDEVHLTSLRDILEISAYAYCIACSSILDLSSLNCKTTMFPRFYTCQINALDKNSNVFVDIITGTCIPLPIRIDKLWFTRSSSKGLQESFSVVVGNTCLQCIFLIKHYQVL